LPDRWLLGYSSLDAGNPRDRSRLLPEERTAGNSGSGYVVRSLEAALWAFYKSDNFRDGCLLAANLGDDADTTAAVYGQLAGAFYGEGGIPKPWIEKLALRSTIVSFADRLAHSSQQAGNPSHRFVSEVCKAVDEDTALVSFERSYWVVPGKFLAGAYPGDFVPEKAELKLRALISAGIRCILDLTSIEDRILSGRSLVLYRELAEKLAATEGFEISYHRQSITDLDVPSVNQMREILDLVDAAIASDRPVYVHCLGGIGRTGTVVGCWLARHGVARGPAVIDLIQRLRRSEAHTHVTSPETADQILFVSEWKAGD